MLYSDDFDPMTDDPENEGKCSVVIALMQEHRRSQRHMGVKTLQIGFILYQVRTRKVPSVELVCLYDIHLSDSII